MQQLESRVSRLEGAFEQIADRLGSIDARFASLEASITARFDSIERRMEGIESGQRWLIGLMVSALIAIVLAIIFHR